MSRIIQNLSEMSLVDLVALKSELEAIGHDDPDKWLEKVQDEIDRRLEYINYDK